MEKTSILNKDNKQTRSKVSIINNAVIIITTIAILVAVILAYIAIAKGIKVPKYENGVQTGDTPFSITGTKLIDYFILPILALLTMAGVISVVASNNKFPMTLLVFSSLATIYKFLYPLVQLLAGQQEINSSPLIGQPIAFFTLMIQVYFWVKWNKLTDEGKFISASFKGKRTYIALSIIGTVFLIQILFSMWINGGNIWTVFIDVAGSMLYFTASILMGFGNILCFPVFFLSDMTWLYWTIIDLATTNNALLILFSTLTLLEIVAYSILAVTGFIQWFNDDYVIFNRRILKIRSVYTRTYAKWALVK